MRGRGNDELAPSRDLLEEFNDYKARFSRNPGYATAYDFAWDKSEYESKFRAQIRGSHSAMLKLQSIAERARRRDVFLICYEAYDKPCHRKLLLQIAEEEFGANVDPSPFLPAGTEGGKAKKHQAEPSLF